MNICIFSARSEAAMSFFLPRRLTKRRNLCSEENPFQLILSQTLEQALRKSLLQCYLRILAKAPLGRLQLRKGISKWKTPPRPENSQPTRALVFCQLTPARLYGLRVLSTRPTPRLRHPWHQYGLLRPQSAHQASPLGAMIVTPSHSTLLEFIRRTTCSTLFFRHIPHSVAHSFPSLNHKSDAVP